MNINISKAQAWLSGNKIKVKAVEEVQKSLLEKAFNNLMKWFEKRAVLREDVRDLEKQYDRSILSFFRFLKDHVNDSIVDFFLYAGFIS